MNQQLKRNWPFIVALFLVMVIQAVETLLHGRIFSSALASLGLPILGQTFDLVLGPLLGFLAFIMLFTQMRGILIFSFCYGLLFFLGKYWFNESLKHAFIFGTHFYALLLPFVVWSMSLKKYKRAHILIRVGIAYSLLFNANLFFFSGNFNFLSLSSLLYSTAIDYQLLIEFSLFILSIIGGLGAFIIKRSSFYLSFSILLYLARTIQFWKLNSISLFEFVETTSLCLMIAGLGLKLLNEKSDRPLDFLLKRDFSSKIVDDLK